MNRSGEPLKNCFLLSERSGPSVYFTHANPQHCRYILVFHRVILELTLIAIEKNQCVEHLLRFMIYLLHHTFKFFSFFSPECHSIFPHSDLPMVEFNL